MKEEGKLIKVIFKYEGDVSKYIDGERLEKWMKASNAASVMMFAHGGGKSGFEGIKWTKVKK